MYPGPQSPHPPMPPHGQYAPRGAPPGAPIRYTVETTTPLWRLIAVILGAGAIAAIGFYVREVGMVEDFATVAVIALGFSIQFWAKKRPDRVRARLGPFARVGLAFRESAEDIERWVYARPFLAGVMVAIVYGVVVVILKHGLVLALQSLYSWYLVVAIGAIIGAWTAAPHMYAAMAERMRVEVPQQYGHPPMRPMPTGPIHRHSEPIQRLGLPPAPHPLIVDDRTLSIKRAHLNQE